MQLINVEKMEMKSRLPAAFFGSMIGDDDYTYYTIS
jgi:hypothetical protein